MQTARWVLVLVSSSGLLALASACEKAAETDGSPESAAGVENASAEPGGHAGATDGSGGAVPGAAGSGTASGGSNVTGGASSHETGGASGGTGGSHATGGTGGDQAPWRPFSDDSPWNTPVGDHPTLHQKSAEWIADWVTSSPYGEHLDVNLTGYSIPLYWADSSTPTYTVTCDIGGEGFTSEDGFDATVQMPIPDGATPDPESDGHLLVVDRARELEFGLYAAVNDNGTWTCALGATADLTGTGVRALKKNANPWYLAHGARACGFPLVAGLIRLEEIEAARIDHALVVAYPHIRGGCYTSPASTAQAPTNDAHNDRGIPCGGRIQLDPELDLESLGLDGSATTIARALQQYGAYVGDYSGAMSLYGEASPEALTRWEKLIDQDMIDKIPIDRFRVIAHTGPVYADDNAGTGYVCE
ncbi:MAG: hypothetical protein JW940_17670 [Polyangiaceae bacterium]|nr:hypothetical protein [Polyangiaceae bacterium]